MNIPKQNKNTLKELFHLRHDQDQADNIDNDIRAGVRVAGTNLWVLMFAILIASIGLNVNSTAVIIGAMLISPLMGPIIGMGYGAAVNDVRLIRLALRNILIFIALSLITSSLYFWLSPLKAAGSELLARTEPTLWDVLIAFFGGSAGIIAITRKEISNVVPGVAIATALMPPLCTAGYALSHGRWDYFAGAFYLFTINCVFIAFSTLLFSKLMKLPKRGIMDGTTRQIHRIMISLIVLAVMLPSAYLASKMVANEWFQNQAQQAIREVQRDTPFLILRHQIDKRKRQIDLIIGGSNQAQSVQTQLQQRFPNAQIHVQYAGADQADLNVLKQEMSEHSSQQQSEMSAQLHYLSQKISEYEREKQEQQQAEQANPHQDLLNEIRAQYPEIRDVAILSGQQWAQAASQAQSVNMIVVQGKINTQQRARLQAWLKVRLHDETMELMVRP